MGKKRKRSLLEVLGIIAIVGGIAGYAAYKMFTKVWVEKTSLKNLRPTIIGLTGTVVLSVKNAGTLPFNIQGFNGEILYNGISLADLFIGPITIAPGITEIPVEFSAPWSEIPNSLTQIFEAKAWYPQFSVKGTLRAAKLNIPISQQLWIV
jgi:hypothetical protein